MGGRGKGVPRELLLLLFSGGVKSQLTERGVPAPPPEVRGVPKVPTAEDDDAESAEDDLAAIEVVAGAEVEVEEEEEEALELFCSSP